MGAGEIENAGRQLFARINTAKAEKGQNEKLDAKEVAQANALGFGNLFELKDNMTEGEFIAEYGSVKFNNEQEEKAFEQQERNIHVKYIQLKYGVKTEIQDGESIEQFEARAKDEGLNNVIDEAIEKMNFGLNSIIPDKKPVKSGRLSYREALSLVSRLGNSIKDGGSKEYSFKTEEGTVHIFLDNAFSSKHKGSLTITYPNGTMETYDANGQRVTSTGEKVKENKLSFLDQFGSQDPQTYR